MRIRCFITFIGGVQAYGDEGVAAPKRNKYADLFVKVKYFTELCNSNFAPMSKGCQGAITLLINKHYINITAIMSTSLFASFAIGGGITACKSSSYTSRKSTFLVRLLLLVLLGVGSLGQASAQHSPDSVYFDKESFPDSLFRDYLQRYFNAWRITKVKAEKITRLDISSYISWYMRSHYGKIPVMENTDGIENFPNLQILYMTNAGLKRIDVSKLKYLTELGLSGNNLTSLDVSNCDSLKKLNVGRNRLAALDVSKNSKLTSLYAKNNLLTSLDITNNKALTEIEVSGNKLTNLDVSQNTAVTRLYANDNELTELDISNMPDLYDFEASNNKLQSLDVSNKANLDFFYAENNLLSSLDFRNSPGLNRLRVGSNQLTELYLPDHDENLQEIICDSNRIEELDLSGFPGLEFLDCASNKIRTLSIASCPELGLINIGDNQLTAVNLSTLEKLNSDREHVPTVNPQQSSRSIYLSGSQAYLALPDDFDTDSVYSLTLTLDGASDSTSFTVGEKTSDGLVQLFLPDDFVTKARQRLFNYSDGSVSPMTITYNYATGLQGYALGAYKYYKEEGDITDDLTTMSVTINATCYMLPVGGETDAGEHYGSVCLPYDFTVPEGVAAYSVTAVGTDAVTLNTVAGAGGVVPANTPVVIKTDNSLSLLALNKADAETTAVSGNLLQGTADEAITATDDIYVLGRNSETGKMGFWHPADGKVGSWRVYLDASKFASASAKGFSLSFDGATGISQLPSEAAAATDGYWYTLSGTRLRTAPTEKGIYIHEGKKVVIK